MVVDEEVQLSAAGLLQEIKLELFTRALNPDVFSGTRSGETDPAQTQAAIARTAHRAIGVPAIRIPAGRAEVAITAVRPARIGEAGAAVSEMGLQHVAHGVCPIVRRRMRIAKLKDVYRLAFCVAAVELEEKRNQRAFILDGGWPACAAHCIFQFDERRGSQLRRNHGNSRCRSVCR